MNGKIVSRVAVVESVEKFLDINDGLYYYLHRLRKFNKRSNVGVEIQLVSNRRLLRKGEAVKLVISRRE